MKISSISRWLVLAVVISQLGASGVSAAASAGADGLLAPVRFEQIKINGFGLGQAKVHTGKWLPRCVRQMQRGREGEEPLNFIDTAQVLRGGASQVWMIEDPVKAN